MQYCNTRTKELRICYSDFGLSSYHSNVKLEHTAKQGVAIPVRWGAPELVLLRAYSDKSDMLVQLLVPPKYTVIFNYSYSPSFITV